MNSNGCGKGGMFKGKLSSYLQVRPFISGDFLNAFWNVFITTGKNVSIIGNVYEVYDVNLHQDINIMNIYRQWVIIVDI